ncbi:MAG: diacylglycerol kinase [Hyphomicrobiales bacterium]
MKEKRSLRRYINQFLAACQYSTQGIVHVYKHEASFRRNVFFLGLSLLLTYYFQPGFLYGWLINCAFLAALALECVNTAIELIVDQLGIENKAMGAAKDCGSAAVAIMLLAGLFMWLHYMYLVYFG